MTRAEALQRFEESGALLTGHFLLSSGLHSPKYVQCAKVLQYPDIAEQLCAELAKPWRGKGIDAVVGPALGAVTLAYELARALGARGLFAERIEGTMQLRRGLSVKGGERVIVCEDVLTTGKSADEVIQDVLAPAGAEVAGVAALIDRGGAASFAQFETHTLLSVDAPACAAEECPLCRRGEPVVKPGSRV